MSQNFAVIGHPVAHSLSPFIHQQFAQQTRIPLVYSKIEGDEQQFEQQVSAFFSDSGKGLNVTLPFKQRAFAMASVRTSRCVQAGAANILWMHNGTLHADNTDGVGFIRDLTRYIDLSGKNILILGAGGAARGIMYPLLTMDPGSLTVANRGLTNARALQNDFPEISCCSLDRILGSFDLIINATAASLDGKIIELPSMVLLHKPLCYDLVYDRDQDTPFVAYAKNSGCHALDGMGMLVEQAAEAFFIWNKVLPDTKPILDILAKRAKQG